MALSKNANVKKVFSVLLVLILAIGLPIHAFAYVGTGRVCYNSSLSEGLTTPINNILWMEDYDSTVVADPSVSSVKDYFDTKNIIFHTHGSPGLFVCSNGNITTTTINDSFSSGALSNAELIYISACQTGRTSTPYGDMVAKLREKGAQCVIAFKENISASTDYDGIHYFNNVVFAYARSNSSIADAIEEAIIDYDYTYGWDCGHTSIRYSGNFSFL